MNTKYKFLLLFLFSTLMHLINSPKTEAEDVCVRSNFNILSQTEINNICLETCQRWNGNFKWNNQWNGPQTTKGTKCQDASVCGCTPDPEKSCYFRQEQCTSLLHCYHFKDPKAKEQCNKKPVYNKAVNCFNACKIEQERGACAKEIPCKTHYRVCLMAKSGPIFPRLITPPFLIQEPEVPEGFGREGREEQFQQLRTRILTL